jgi:glutaredoxin
MKPLLYVKTGCPWCHEAEEFLKQHHVAYDRKVVTGNAEAFQEMVDLSGQSKAPVLDWHGDVLADFGAAELEPFLKERSVI